MLIGWRLIPKRQGQSARDDLFEVEKYVTEVRLPGDSRLVGKYLPEINAFVDNGVNVLGLVRDGERRLALSPQTEFRGGDILILQIDTASLETLVAKARVNLVGSERIISDDLQSDEVRLMEAVVMDESLLIRGTAFSLDLRRRYGVNLLAVSRQGLRLAARLDRIRIRAGDVLLLQCPVETARQSLATLGCLPLAPREIRIGRPQQLILPLVIFGAALLASAVGLAPVQIAFLVAVVVLLMAGFVSLREAYDSIDWPIIILLGAMIPVGEALETSGGAQLIANLLLQVADWVPPAAVLALVMLVTMLLTPVMNNAAAVVLVAPVGISVARGLGVPVDPFLMAIAIGASCDFLTPIGHQSNTLVMGPGGYKFGDYWRMGLLLEIVVVLVAIPLILVFWPL